jgi:flagellar basal-body rod protein FlgF
MQPAASLRMLSPPSSEPLHTEHGLVDRPRAPIEADPNAAVKSRALEGSNVSAIEEMVATMTLNRTFEMQMKMFTASDKMNEAGNRLLGGA